MPHHRRRIVKQAPMPSHLDRSATGFPKQTSKELLDIAKKEFLRRAETELWRSWPIDWQRMRSIRIGDELRALLEDYDALIWPTPEAFFTTLRLLLDGLGQMPNNVIEEELRHLAAHFHQEIEDFRKEGLSEQQAWERTINKYGNPVKVFVAHVYPLGAQFFQSVAPRQEWKFILFAVMLRVIATTDFALVGIPLVLLVNVTLVSLQFLTLMPWLAMPIFLIIFLLLLFCVLARRRSVGKRGRTIFTWLKNWIVLQAIQRISRRRPA